MNANGYDAIVLVGFGGPESKEELHPFLDRVLRGRDVPAERHAEVAAHYLHVSPDGRSPYNELTRSQARALRAALLRRGITVPIRIAYRNVPPFVSDVVDGLVELGARRVLAIVLAVQRGSASIGRYVDALEKARRPYGDALQIDYIEPFFDHPLFIQAQIERAQHALEKLGREAFDDTTALVFTAHSIPEAVANAGPYVADVERTASLVAAALRARQWIIAFQSRSGRSSVPWLEPDVRDVLRALPGLGVERCVVAPIGFLCDNVEVLYDLDVDAAAVAADCGLPMARAATVNDHPLFIEMLADLVEKQLQNARMAI